MSTFNGTIRMALATKADEEVGYELVNLLESIDRGDYVAADVDGEAEDDWFDEDDINHHKALHARLKKIADQSGALWRILGGWSCITNPKNALLDLSKDTVDFHPRIAAAAELLQFAQLVLRGIESGHVKATPFLDFSDANAESIPMRSIGDAARAVIAKATGEQA
ncbi:hypothetical protein [Paraburkholderia tuberum]|uniref:Uncharacterized protein n=1 Tax=Paraburkholderia tuberum TaxID=157910 RepID=A0A1H1JCF6_9BURK|nr:hypothetical protein [Paraburkholderia tuberum]SDR47326.1 hypothetical protein SAMN05445850_4536 [Paraburkholderia tuberum]